MTKDGSYVRIHALMPQNEEEKDNLFHAIRLFYLYLAQKKGFYAIHSASILYQKRAWLFSGHSGMGKSTHTELWHERVHTPYLNGDLNLVGIENGKLKVYGMHGAELPGFSQQVHRSLAESSCLEGMIMIIWKG